MNGPLSGVNGWTTGILVVHPRLIATARLRAIQGGVCRLEQRFTDIDIAGGDRSCGRAAIDKGAGATDADRQRPCGKRTAREHRRAVMDGPTQVIRDLAALARRAPRNRDGEFVAAVATSDGASGLTV